ncbi:MAG TPA: cysteine--tRNA ligase [Actinomycetales bacterium]|nr:cysteine--tRNA ligase [Actinomycetales bacterium]
MSLKLFDTATRTVREFEPLVPGKVGIYLCGATVQSSPHIGHLRSAIAFDVLVRWLRRLGYDVTFVRNVTDIDDKILDKAAANNAQWWAWALRFEREFTAAYDALNITPPDYEPRATGHILDMVDIIERLIERGHAYADPSGSADVWFDVPSFPDYGALTHQDPAEMLSSGDGGESTKRDPRDFALWKSAKPGEPETASWPTPFGRGRPGWHIECSAMARRYLGDSFDIHAGGLDLRFPHHENEQAQSRAAGFGFAQYWLHNAWVTTAGEKMSKSLGNSLQVATILETVAPQALRYALGVAQYRSMIEFTADSLPEATSAWERLAGFIERAGEIVEVDATADLNDVELPEDFVEAMNDDLNVSAALAVVHEELRAGNQALTDVDRRALGEHVLRLRAMLDVLGLDPLDPAWRSGLGAISSDAARTALDQLVTAQLIARDEARSARDFATADAIRDQLTAAGIVVEDSVRGARWSLQASPPQGTASQGSFEGSSSQGEN